MKLPLLFILLSSICYSQNQFNNWFFGTNLGLNFSTPIPTLITGGQINQAEGNATISDASGNPDWGAEPNKLYFVIKHGNEIKQHLNNI